MTDLDERDGSLPESRKHSLRDVEKEDVVVTLDGEVVNLATGHKDQLHRHYGLLSICGLALTVDNAWVAIGTSLSIAICRSSLPGSRAAFQLTLFRQRRAAWSIVR